jgi:hypothetical protein
MSYIQCNYCRGACRGDKEEYNRTCSSCKKQLKKLEFLDEDLISWLMSVIDGRITDELENHVDRYSHESSDRGIF